MDDLAQLAQHAVAAIAPILPFAATKAAEGFFKEPGAQLFKWLFDKWKGTPSAHVLDRAIEEPANPRRLQVLGLEIADLAEKDPDFRKQLKAHLSSLSSPNIVISEQTIRLTNSNNNKLSEASGNNIKVNIS